MGSRLDDEFDGAQSDCASLHGEFRDAPGVLISNNNHEIDSRKGAPTNNNDKNTTENESVGNGNNSINSNITAQGVIGGNTSSSIVAESIVSQDKFEKPIIIDTYGELKRLSAASSPVENQSSSSEKSVSPINKDNSPVIKKDPSHSIDCNRTSPSNGKYHEFLMIIIYLF